MKYYKKIVVHNLFRFISVLCAVILLTGMPASAARLNSIGVNGAQIAYESQYKAYTAAAADEDSAICQFTVQNPSAGKNGALCRIVMPQNRNYYVYIDDGALTVMRYDGAEYKNFNSNYKLKKGTKYTLCVFADGLVLMDGIQCFVYSASLYGFTDIQPGWSSESNVFSVELTEFTPGTKPEEDTSNQPASSAPSGQAQPSQAVASAQPTNSILIILVILLCLSSNILALISVRSSNIALHTVQKLTLVFAGDNVKAANLQKNNTFKKTKSALQSKAKPKQAKPVPSVPSAQPVQPAPPVQPVPPTARATRSAATKNSNSQNTSAAASEMPQPLKSSAKMRKYHIIRVENLTTKNKTVNPDPAAHLQHPFQLYMDAYWQSHPELLVFWRFGSLKKGYCTFVPGKETATDPIVTFPNHNTQVWLNPFRYKSVQDKIVLTPSDFSGLTLAFDFYQVNSSSRSITMYQDVEMVNLIPAEVKSEMGGTLGLVKKGVIVFEPLQ